MPIILLSCSPLLTWSSFGRKTTGLRIGVAENNSEPRVDPEAEKKGVDSKKVTSALI